MSSHGAPSVAEVHRTLLEERSESSEVFTVGFTDDPLAAFVDVLADFDDPPPVRVLATESVLKWLRRDFHLASTAADLIAADALSLRVPDQDRFEAALVVDEESVVSVLTAGRRTVAPAIDDTEFAETMCERCASAWETGAAFDLRTPARSRVYETLADEIATDVASDFQEMVEAVETTRGGGHGTTADADALDEVALALLVAAKNDVQLYEISRWGENVGIASKATFSRTKITLEEEGVVGTEKVPTDVGRPRLRLKLAPERLRGMESSALPDAVREMLGSTAG